MTPSKNVKTGLSLLSLLLVFLVNGQAMAQSTMIQQINSASPDQLQRLLKRYPDADSNKDGILSRNEARAYVAERRGQTSRTTGGPAASVVRQPDFEDVPYGPHARHRLDVWKSSVSKTAPMVVFIHGGGFRNGSKSKWRSNEALRAVLDNGYSAAALNYPFLKDQPIQDILKDAATAIQFLRSQSDQFHFDANRMAGWGGSAGAGTSLWLTTRDDLADPNSDHRIARQSSRLQAAVLQGTQATYDLTRWIEFLGPSRPEWQKPGEIFGFYHLKSEDELGSPKGQAIRRECDMLQWISPDDGPLWIANPPSQKPPENRNQYLHHFLHAQAINDVCRQHQVQCELAQKAPSVASAVRFLESVFEESNRPTGER